MSTSNKLQSLLLEGLHAYEVKWGPLSLGTIELLALGITALSPETPTARGKFAILKYRANGVFMLSKMQSFMLPERAYHLWIPLFTVPPSPALPVLLQSFKQEYRSYTTPNLSELWPGLIFSGHTE